VSGAGGNNTRGRAARPERRAAPQPPRTVLVLGVATGDSDDLIAELEARADLRIVLAWGAEQARRAVEREGPVLALATADVPTEWVDAVVAAIGRHRPGTPVLALRDAGAEQPERWSDRGVGVLRCPLVPLALSRSIDVVLSLRAGP
jgi:hypothetical protein